MKNTFILIICCSFLFAIRISAREEIIISEVFYDTPFYENDKGTLPSTHNGEFIELYNPTDHDIDITGYELIASPHRFELPDNSVIKPDDYLLVCFQSNRSTSDSPLGKDTVFSTFKDLFQNAPVETNKIIYQNRLLLKNTNQTIFLVNKEYEEVDKFVYDSSRRIYAHNGYNKKEKLKSLQRVANGYIIGEPTPGQVDLKVNVKQDYQAYPDYIGEATTKLINTNLAPIDFAGSASVSSTGAANYSIPLEVPDGIGGIQPQLSIDYNSQGGTGCVGRGWEIAGFSMISRVAPNIEFDDVTRGMSFSQSDGFVLDGKRLIYKSNNKYICETDPFLDITSDGTTFRIINRDGIISEYGLRNNSSVCLDNSPDSVVSFKLNRLTDRNGNYIEYYYKDLQGENVIDKIVYTGNNQNNSKGQYTVSFVWRTRKEYSRPIFIAGKKLVPVSLLMKILVWGPNNRYVTGYEFSYIKGDGLRRDLLNTVRRRNPHGERLNEIVISWNDQVPRIEDIRNDISPLDLSGRWISGDINGDGISDVINVTKHKDPGIFQQAKLDITVQVSLLADKGIRYVYLHEEENCPDSFGMPFIINQPNSNFKVIMLPVCEGKNWYLQSYHCNSTRLIKGDKLFIATTEKDRSVVFTVGDLNNDGLDDIAISCGHIIKQNTIYSGQAYIFLQLQLGQFKKQQDIEWHNLPQKEGSDADQLFISDFDKDGLADLAILTHDELLLYKNRSVFTLREQSLELVEWHRAHDINTIADVVRAGDFNGDGLLDFIYCSSRTRQWRLATNKGNWRFDHSDIPARIINAYEEPIGDNDNKDAFYAYDFNNDGLCDFVYWDAEYTNVNVSKDKGRVTSYKLRFLESKGTYFECVREEYQQLFFKGEPHRNTDLIGDFNGDGAAEYVCNVSGGMVGYGMPIGKTYHVVSDIATGMNQKIHFDYQTLAGSPKEFYAQSVCYAAYPITNVQPPLMCVQTMKVENPGQETQTTTYSYSGAKLHLVVGFLGFERISALNLLTGVKDITKNEFSPEGWLSRVIAIRSQKNQLLSETTRDYIHVVDENGSRFSYISSACEKDHLNSTVCNTRNTYDEELGYLLKQERNFDDNIVFTDNFSEFVLNKPTVITHTCSYPGADKISYLTTCRYDESGNLLQRNEYDGTDKKIVTQYDNYTSSGLPGMKKTIAGEVCLVENYKYNDAGWLIEKEDYQGKTIYRYDQLTGNLLSIITPDGLTETNVYDVWGRLISHISGSGVVTTYRTEWALNDSDVPSVIKESTQTNDFPPVVVWYDALGRECKRESTIRNLLARTIRTYDSYGNPESLFSWLGDLRTKSRFDQYDEYGRIIRSTDNLSGKEITYTYAERARTICENNSSYIFRYNSQGDILSSESAGGRVSFTYNSLGLPQYVSATNVNLRLLYDICGNRTLLQDLLTGERSISEYNASGNLIYERDAENNIIRLNYDQYGRLTGRYVNEVREASYEYISQGNGLGKIKKITGSDSDIYQIFEYDKYGQMTVNEFGLGADMDPVSFYYTYDATGNLIRTIYPNNIVINNSYINNELWDVRYGNDKIWSNLQLDARTIKNVLGNGLTATTNYDAYGNLTEIKVSGNNIVQIDYKYDFDPVTGLLKQRDVEEVVEAFSYDDQKRLTTINFPRFIRDTVQVIRYKDNLIDYKTGCGRYQYQVTRPVTIIPDETTNYDLLTGADSLAYTPSGDIAYISRGDRHAVFQYGPDQRRICMKEYRKDKLLKTIYYVGMYEIQVDSTGRRHDICYVKAGNDMPAMLVTENNIAYIYYFHTDHLGSITGVSDNVGNMIARYHYNPWGDRQQIAGLPFDVTTRGFTGHEHLSHFGLINMNGRLYDPHLGVFLSEDNFIQLPDNIQNYNRYAYCLNNPLHLTDRSGELFGLDDIVVAAIAVGVIAGTANVIANWDNINGFWQGFTSFFVAAGAAVATVYTGGMAGGSWAAAVTVSSIGGGINGATNSIIAQTGKNFEGIENVDWDAVSISSASGIASSAVSSGIGYYGAVHPYLTFNSFNITSPVLKSAAYSVLPSMGGHMVGGMSAGLLSGKDWEDSWESTTSSLGKSISSGIVSSVATTAGIAVSMGVNPINGGPLVSGYPDPSYVEGSNHSKYLRKGEVIDRYGEPTGKYASPINTPFESRSLAPAIKYKPYNVYQVKKTILVEQSVVAPAFGQPGGGIQYKFGVPLQQLIDRQLLKKVN